MLAKALLLAIVAFVVVGATAIAAPSPSNKDGGTGETSRSPGHNTRSEHWGVIARNTIGSPVADHRNGPYGSFGVTGPSGRPPFGKGSLGIAVATNSTNRVPPSEKAYFGNEVDFYGDNVLALREVGFHVFQTGENVSYGGPRNMPNIIFEIDANLTNPLCAADNYTSMVWVPDASPALNQWSGYLDATSTGYWYFTGNEGVCTGCTEASNCTFAQAKTALNDGPPAPVMYTAAINKGRDFLWAGAVDGFRINSSIFDFELLGVFERHVGGGGDDDD